MFKSDVDRLHEVVWIDVDGTDLKIAIVPAAAGMLGSILAGIEGLGHVRRICEQGFVDFKNYYDDPKAKKPVKNSLEERIKLFGALAVRRAVIDRLTEENERIARGEGVAASA